MRATTDPASRHFRGPSLDDWRPILHPQPDTTKPTKLAVITAHEVNLFGSPGDRWAIGTARIGSRLPAERSDKGSCSGGDWYVVSGGAYLCTGEGVTIVDAPLASPILGEVDLLRRPTLDQPSPFEYAKAIAGGPPSFERLPTADEIADVVAGNAPSSLVKRHFKGNYLLALARSLDVEGNKFYETVDGSFVRADDLDPRPTPPMHGEHLEGDHTLPLAFAIRDTKLLCLDGDDAASECGKVDKHARFQPGDTVERDGKELVLTSVGDAVPREDLRVVERVDRPDGVGDDDRWIHIDLTEQSLVAYEGDEPVLATLVSSGLPGHDTLPGLFKVNRKYLTKTMRGTDEGGPYEVQEVPWTLFYDGNYAVHGAYWHNRFGRTKSHGCVNVPPADARWLYYWADPKLPTGWSAMFHKLGTWVYVTGKTPPEVED